MGYCSQIDGYAGHALPGTGVLTTSDVGHSFGLVIYWSKLLLLLVVDLATYNRAFTVMARPETLRLLRYMGTDLCVSRDTVKSAR